VKHQRLLPSALPGFLTSVWFKFVITHHQQGNIFQTAATAAKDPFQTFQAARLSKRDNKV
jgi:hypothetical protein